MIWKKIRFPRKSKSHLAIPADPGSGRYCRSIKMFKIKQEDLYFENKEVFSSAARSNHGHLPCPHGSSYRQ